MAANSTMTRAEVLTDVHLRISIAPRTGKGIRLSAKDCWGLDGDSPITVTAELVAENAGFKFDSHGKLVPLNDD